MNERIKVFEVDLNDPKLSPQNEAQFRAAACAITNELWPNISGAITALLRTYPGLQDNPAGAHLIAGGICMYAVAAVKVQMKTDADARRAIETLTDIMLAQIEQLINDRRSFVVAPSTSGRTQ